jgi:hypothetical protein
MKNLFLSLSFLTILGACAVAQEYRVVTTIESIVPGGAGRSRMLEAKQTADHRSLTTARTDGKKSTQDEISREDVRIEAFEETKLLNFFSVSGINIQNVASNDAVITSKLNEMAKEGFSLAFVTSGVESDGGDTDGNGIFVTRYIFKKDAPTTQTPAN